MDQTDSILPVNSFTQYRPGCEGEEIELSYSTSDDGRTGIGCRIIQRGHLVPGPSYMGCFNVSTRFASRNISEAMHGICMENANGELDLPCNSIDIEIGGCDNSGPLPWAILPRFSFTSPGARVGYNDYWLNKNGDISPASRITISGREHPVDQIADRSKLRGGAFWVLATVANKAKQMVKD